LSPSSTWSASRSSGATIRRSMRPRGMRCRPPTGPGSRLRACGTATSACRSSSSCCAAGTSDLHLGTAALAGVADPAQPGATHPTASAAWIPCHDVVRLRPAADGARCALRRKSRQSDLSCRATLTQFRLEILLLVILMVILVVGPLLVFAPQLSRAAARACASTDGGATLRRDFDAKWVRAKAPR